MTAARSSSVTHEGPTVGQQEEKTTSLGRQQLPPPKRCRGWKAPRSVMPLPRGIPAASHFMFFWQIQHSVTHTPASGAPESCIADPGWKTRPSGQKKHQKPPESGAGTQGWVRGALLEERGMRAGTESHCRELQEAVGRGKGAPQRTAPRCPP